MKLLLRIVLTLMLLVLIAMGVAYITGHQYLVKGVWATYLHGEKTATIDDARFFDTRKIPAHNPQAWSFAENYNTPTLSDTLLQTLNLTETVAFLIVKNDKILLEKYWDGYSDTSHSNSFSMAKSITTLLAQIAIQEGYLQSWNDKVIHYLPNIQGPFANELELWHLSTMTAGLQWSEHYTNAFDITAKAYYGPDVERLMYEQVPVIEKPGAVYEYQSGASQLLGLVLTKATGLSVSEFASKYLWSPIGARHAAYWHLDAQDGQELTYCCFNSNARDFARLGQLMLDSGRYYSQQIIDPAFVAKAQHGVGVDYYGWSFWVYNQLNTPCYYYRGILGQYIIVFPEKNLVVCRLGKKRLENENNHPKDFQVIAEECLKYFGY